LPGPRFHQRSDRRISSRSAASILRGMAIAVCVALPAGHARAAASVPAPPAPRSTEPNAVAPGGLVGAASDGGRVIAMCLDRQAADVGEVASPASPARATAARPAQAGVDAFQLGDAGQVRERIATIEPRRGFRWWSFAGRTALGATAVLLNSWARNRDASTRGGNQIARATDVDAGKGRANAAKTMGIPLVGRVAAGLGLRSYVVLSRPTHGAAASRPVGLAFGRAFP
jgi:hypothetical protein